VEGTVVLGGKPVPYADGYFLRPASLAAEEAKATTVVLTAGQAAKVDVTLLRPEEQTR